MCVSCGCGAPNDDHGNAANITMLDVEKAAQAAEISPSQVAANISSSC